MNRSLTSFSILAGVLILLGTLTHLHGQIGASKDALVARYGEAHPTGKLLTKQYDQVVDEYYSFVHNGIITLAGLKKNQTVMLMYRKKDGTLLTRDEVFSVLRDSTEKPDWVLVSGTEPNPRWRLGNSSAFAYYFTDDGYNNPPSLVRIQTAALDCIYRKILQDAGLKKAAAPLPVGSDADIKPTDPSLPVFQVFVSKEMESDKPGIPRVTWDSKNPLLTVYTVRDLILAADQQGVLIGLNKADTKTFSTITHKYDGQILLIHAGDETVEALHVTAPIEDGYIGFKYPTEAKMAEYLRKRFQIAEFQPVKKE